VYPAPYDVRSSIRRAACVSGIGEAP
jgi:hypothetical protein